MDYAEKIAEQLSFKLQVYNVCLGLIVIFTWSLVFQAV